MSTMTRKNHRRGGWGNPFNFFTKKTTPDATATPTSQPDTIPLVDTDGIVVVYSLTEIKSHITAGKTTNSAGNPVYNNVGFCIQNGTSPPIYCKTTKKNIFGHCANTPNFVMVDCKKIVPNGIHSGRWVSMAYINMVIGNTQIVVLFDEMLKTLALNDGNYSNIIVDKSDKSDKSETINIAYQSSTDYYRILRSNPDNDNMQFNYFYLSRLFHPNNLNGYNTLFTNLKDALDILKTEEGEHAAKLIYEANKCITLNDVKLYKMSQSNTNLLLENGSSNGSDNNTSAFISSLESSFSSIINASVPSQPTGTPTSLNATPMGTPTGTQTTNATQAGVQTTNALQQSQQTQPSEFVFNWNKLFGRDNATPTGEPAPHKQTVTFDSSIDEVNGILDQNVTLTKEDTQPWDTAKNQAYQFFHTLRNKTPIRKNKSRKTIKTELNHTAQKAKMNGPITQTQTQTPTTSSKTTNSTTTSNKNNPMVHDLEKELAKKFGNK